MEFSDAEKGFIDCLDARWRYIARDKSGNLFLYEEEPFAKNDTYFSKSGFCVSMKVVLKPSMFADLTFEAGPVCIRVLTGHEAEFLGDILDAFGWKNKDFSVCKKHSAGGSYLYIYRDDDDCFSLPKFADDEKYIDMEYDRPYTKQELKLWN